MPTRASPSSIAASPSESVSARRIRIDGLPDVFHCEADDTIARAALRAGLGFPYECNVGSCGTCRFVLVDGEVEHRRDAPPAWTERDLKRNRFLGCQAAPKGDCLVKVMLDPAYVPDPRPRRFKARLTGFDELNHDMRAFHFEPLERQAFRAGQYALFDLPGVAGWRPYSMSCAPGRTWSFIIRRVPGGAATTVLFDHLPAGSTVELDGPYGCAYLREDAPRDILCVAGGSGLSPIVATAAAAAASPTLAGRRIHVVYGGRTPRDIVGEELLAGLPGFGSRITYTPAISVAESASGSGWEGRIGFAHEVARSLFGERMRQMEVYFAGPPAMSEAMQLMLHELQVPPEQVHFDQFF